MVSRNCPATKKHEVDRRQDHRKQRKIRKSSQAMQRTHFSQRVRAAGEKKGGAQKNKETAPHQKKCFGRGAVSLLFCVPPLFRAPRPDVFEGLEGLNFSCRVGSSLWVALLSCEDELFFPSSVSGSVSGIFHTRTPLHRAVCSKAHVGHLRRCT